MAPIRLSLRGCCAEQSPPQSLRPGSGLQGRKECGQPFREVVDGDRECSEQAHAQKLSLVPTMVVDVVSPPPGEPERPHRNRPGGGGVAECAISFPHVSHADSRPMVNQVVDDADQKHAAKEGCRIDPLPPVISVSLCQCINPLVEDFNKERTA